MQTVATIKSLRKKLAAARKRGKTIGFVPTMGFLHEGHLSLVGRAWRENDVVVASIFVNPIQFGPREDFRKYPRDFGRDVALLKKTGVDYIFRPSAKEIFPADFGTYVEVPGLSSIMCGRSRPGHFRGVATVVAKLLNIVQPDRSYFGLKDYQQFIIIKKMAEDLDIPGQIIGCPTVREKDGLAMSSRNIYLKTPRARKAALVLKRCLWEAERLVKNGEKRSGKIRQKMMKMIKRETLARLDYIAIADPATLDEVRTIKGPVLIALAVYIEKARLVDNLII